MTYLITTTHPGGDPETFRKIDDRVKAHAHGLVARYAGMTEFGIAITTIWESKAHSDRFAAEHLVPALHDIVGDQPSADGVVVEFDAFDAFIPDGAA